MRKFLVFLIIVTLYTELSSQQLIIKLSEGFESTTFPPQGWKRINLMGANQWIKLTSPLPSVIMQPPIQGTAVARIDYQYEGGDDWLITKKITSIESGDSLIFFLIKQSNEGPFPPDSMIIRVSTTDSIQSSFSNVILRISIAGIPIGTQVWHKYSVSLNQFAGQNIYIAFQHKDVNGHGCAIDSIVVFNPNSIGIRKIDNIIPDKSELYQNYPNPFNPSTNIKFQIPRHGGSTTNNLPRQVTLKVFDMLGKEVKTLVNEILNAGLYQVSFSGYELPSGIYFYKLETGDFSAVKTMIIIK
jgi:hypothetical protein